MNESVGGRTPVPPAVWVFGLSTLIPFFAASVLFCYGPAKLQNSALIALLAYVFDWLLRYFQRFFFHYRKDL